MALTVTTATGDEPLTLLEAKRHLRRLDNDLDDVIAQNVSEAREYCERYTQRTLRSSVTRLWTLSQWWGGVLTLPWPPLLSVTGITYYDADNASQTFATANYQVVTSTEGAGSIHYTDGATVPSIYARPDAVSITFVTGYATPPQVALRAMKTKLTEMWGVGAPQEIEAARVGTDRLLNAIDWTGYA